MQTRCKEIKKFKSDLTRIPHMQSSNDIQELIDKIGFRGRNSKNYEEMKIEKIGEELRDAMKFEQDTLEKIAVLEQRRQNRDLVQYARIICRDTARREIAQIQKKLCVIDFTARNRRLRPTPTYILTCVISLHTRCVIRSNIGVSCVLAPKHLGYVGIRQL